MQRRSTSQDISWFLDLRRHGQLDLDPPYQRRSVWTPKDRRFFLDTVLRGYPCPPIFLHKVAGTDEKTTYAVVDGKQRLQTIFKFVDGEIALAEDFGDTRYNSKKWSDLGLAERQIFWDYVIPVEFLSFDPDDTRAVDQAFDRLNRNMRKLEAQELRHARWDGWFISLVEQECEEPAWRKLGVVTSARSKRMKDAQFMSELILVIIERRQHGFDQEMLDAAYGRYDDLEEADVEVNPDEVKEAIVGAREFLVTAQDSNGVIKDDAATFGAFYTVWALIVLHGAELPDASSFAARLKDFMKKMKLLDSSEDKAALLTGEKAAALKRPMEFLEAYRGASTDLSPRTKRLNALRAFFRNE
jgi:hypothetical protein